MRVISQDGTIDIPYKLTSIQLVSKTTIIAQGSYFGSSSDDNFVTVAEYSTEEKAQKAMEMLHDSYNNFDWIKTTGFSDELKAVCKHITKEDFKALTSPYFRFPKDEDVEE